MEEDTFSCCLCSFSTSGEDAFKDHLFTTHNGEPNSNIRLLLSVCKVTPDYTCSICNKTYCNKNYLSKHHCKPDSLLYHCEKCNKPFKHKSILQRHESKCKGSVQAETTTINKFELDKDDLILFDATHITPDTIVKARSSKGPIVTATNVLQHIMSNPKNKFTMKHDLSHPYSYIHKGNNIWGKVTDSYLFPILVASLVKYITMVYDKLCNINAINNDGSTCYVPLPLKRLEQFIDNINTKSRTRDYIELTHALKEYLVKIYHPT